ncbi:MAG: beta-ketoacyl synthase [Proteobacteria bacterium]|jgi:acetoacetyl-[acyl-carrier protein] synthase|nr:beta-ketoacyl synthase [Pseudomonadota bacterium]
MRLPVIVGFGGVSPAGRSSFHHAYRRTILDSIQGSERSDMFMSLASLMNLREGQNGKPLTAKNVEAEVGQQCLDGSLIRQLENNLFDPDNIPTHMAVELSPDNGANADANRHTNDIIIAAKNLPNPMPEGCSAEALDGGLVRLKISDDAELKLKTLRKLTVQSAGQLPSGFDPAALYQSRFHPRGLQLSIIAASDAVQSVGIDWETIKQHVRPDEVCVYASSAMGQLDKCGSGGMTQARLRGERPSSKQLALGLNQMPADFVNAYVLGSVGSTGAAVGACASFLYNLRLAVDEIKSGRRRVAVVGGAEAPITPEIIEGYAAMSALVTDENLRKLDGVDNPDYRRASRPFGNNAGFVLGESGQYVVLFDDALAMELGASIHGAVSDVFASADGIKKSISSPGPGNYITIAKAVGAARSIVGDAMIREHSFMQAHGSSTPQNRVTESLILDKVAQAFGIDNWPITAVKAYLGHSIGTASGDQLINTLGVLSNEILPGIPTIDKVADDVYADRLNISTTDLGLHGRAEIGFLNSKGFGGNNATGTVLSPRLVAQMMKHRYGEKDYAAYLDRNNAIQEIAQAYDQQCMNGPMPAIYRFGEPPLDDSDITVSSEEVKINGFDNTVDLEFENPYSDMFTG